MKTPAATRWCPLLLLLPLLLCAVASGQPRLLGAPVEAAANDAGVQQALRFALDEYNKASNDKYRSRVAELVRAQKQIVSGINYILRVKIGRTTCTKSTTNVENCAFHDSPELAQKVTCDFIVYIVPWTNHISLRKSHCE